jgi:hypothetical protein
MQCLRSFFDSFDLPGLEDYVVSLIFSFQYILNALILKVTRDEFLHYYSNVSGKDRSNQIIKKKHILYFKASIDDDAYFDLMMRQLW